MFEDILLAVCALLNLCFLQGVGYVLSIGKKSEVAMAYSNGTLQNFASIEKQEKFQVTICNLQFENESRSLPHMTQGHDFRLLGMSHCLFNDTEFLKTVTVMYV